MIEIQRIGGVDMTNTTEILNKQIANWTILYVKLHNYHWYVKGSQFFTLHEKFQLLYEEAATHIDELAERVLALRGNPVATMEDCLSIASVSEAKKTESAEEMVKAIVSDFTTIIEELKQGMQVAVEQKDETTADMLLAIHTELEKHVWMLSSFLQE